MNNPGIKEEIWLALRQKWDKLVADGQTVKVEFNILTGPENTEAFAIDVAQNIDGEWFVQTFQKQVQEAYPLLGIEGMELDQLLNLADRIVDSVTEPITGRRTIDDEMYIFLKRISPETAEIYGHIISQNDEKIGIRADYRHYYVINEILEQISRIMKEEYTGIQLHRNKDDNGRLYYRFVHAE